MTPFIRLATRRPRSAIAAATILAVVAGAVGSQTPGRLGHASNDFVAKGSSSVQAEAAIERASGRSAAPQLLVLVEGPTRERVARVSAAIHAEPAFPLLAAPIRSRSGLAVLIAAYARGDISQALWRQAAERIARRLANVRGTAVGGTALATVQVNEQVQRDLTRAELLAFPVLFLLALFVFRSVVAALLPLLTGALTILGALLLLRGVNAVTPVSTYALNIVTGAGLGSRHRLQPASRLALPRGARTVRSRRRGGACDAATAGRTVAFSCVTVGASIATLAVFPLGFLRSMGIAGGLVGPLAGLIALTVLPALFMLLGPRVNALSPQRWRRAAEETARGVEGGWYRLAHWLMRRPVPVALAASAILLVATLPVALDPLHRDRRLGAAAERQLQRRRRRRAAATSRPRWRRPPMRCSTEQLRRLSGTRAACVRCPRRLSCFHRGGLLAGVWEVQASSGTSFLAARSQRLVREMRAVPAPARVGGSTAQFLDQKTRSARTSRSRSSSSA